MATISDWAGSRHIFSQSRGKSSGNNDSATKKHFTKFYTEVFYPNNRSLREDVTLDNIEVNEITDALVGNFATYLCEASCLTKKNSSLSLLSVSVYMSSLKTSLLTKFSGEEHAPRCFAPEMWKLYLSRIRKVKIKHAIKDNVPLFREYDAATDDDMKALAAVVYWDGCGGLNSEFLYLFLTCVGNCGRGSEVRFYGNIKYFILTYVFANISRHMFFYNILF